MDGEAHGGQRRGNEDHRQHQRAQQPAKEPPHQCASLSPAAPSGVSTFCATAAGAVVGGAAKSSDSRPTSASRMKSIQMGSAACAPVSLLPSVFFSSKPTHTPQVSEGEKPTNHASVKSLVVPVLPPSGCFSLAAEIPVPCKTTSCSRDTMVRAVRELITSLASG